MSQRQCHFAAIDALLDRFLKGRFCGRQLPAAEQHLAQQKMCCQQFVVLLQRILELDDRSGQIIALEALERVFVETRRLFRRGAGLPAAKDGDCDNDENPQCQNQIGIPGKTIHVCAIRRKEKNSVRHPNPYRGAKRKI